MLLRYFNFIKGPWKQRFQTAKSACLSAWTSWFHIYTSLFFGALAKKYKVRKYKFSNSKFVSLTVECIAHKARVIASVIMTKYAAPCFRGMEALFLQAFNKIAISQQPIYQNSWNLVETFLVSSSQQLQNITKLGL